MDDSLIIGFDYEMGIREAIIDSKKETDLDSDHLRPSDVSAVRCPTGGEFTGVPHAVEDNTDAP